MSASDIYSHCQTAAGGLLTAIDGRDLPGIEQQLTRLRGLLSSRDEFSGRRPDRLCDERLDALEGVAEELTLSVRRMRRTELPGLRRMRESAPLLRHLTAGSPGNA